MLTDSNGEVIHLSSHEVPLLCSNSFLVAVLVVEIWNVCRRRCNLSLLSFDSDGGGGGHWAGGGRLDIVFAVLAQDREMLLKNN